MNMHGSFRYLIALCFASAAAFSAYNAVAQDTSSNAAVVAPAQDSSETAYLAENDAAMTRMMDDMSIKPSGDIDRDFVAMMTPHHQGAIDMAKVELQYGKDPELLKLAGDIVAAQEQEIAQMKAWLAKNGGK